MSAKMTADELEKRIVTYKYIKHYYSAVCPVDETLEKLIDDFHAKIDFQIANDTNALLIRQAGESAK